MIADHAKKYGFSRDEIGRVPLEIFSEFDKDRSNYLFVKRAKKAISEDLKTEKIVKNIELPPLIFIPMILIHFFFLKPLEILLVIKKLLKSAWFRSLR